MHWLSFSETCISLTNRHLIHPAVGTSDSVGCCEYACPASSWCLVIVVMFHVNIQNGKNNFMLSHRLLSKVCYVCMLSDYSVAIIIIFVSMDKRDMFTMYVCMWTPWEHRIITYIYISSALHIVAESPRAGRGQKCSVRGSWKTAPPSPWPAVPLPPCQTYMLCLGYFWIDRLGLTGGGGWVEVGIWLLHV